MAVRFIPRRIKKHRVFWSVIIFGTFLVLIKLTLSLPKDVVNYLSQDGGWHVEVKVQTGSQQTAQPRHNETTMASMNATIGSTTHKGNGGASVWSDVLVNSNEYFWGNNWNISFTTHLTMDTELAKLSVGVSFDDPTQHCPHPYFRTRLSGIAMVHIPMDTPQYNQLGAAGRSNPSQVVVNGSAWIPTPGRYFLEVLLLDCTMDAYNKSRTSDELSQQCPLRPVIRKDVKDYSFTVDPFNRPQQAIDEWITESAPYPFLYKAWIFAPKCSNSTYDVSAECTEASLLRPKMIRTKAQVVEYLQYMPNNQTIDERFDEYVYLPVDRQDGSVNYTHEHSVRLYTPPRKDLTLPSFPKKGLCVIGDSYARFVYHEMMRFFTNTTTGTDACDNVIAHPQRAMVKYPHLFIRVPYGDVSPQDVQWFNPCQTVLLSFGRWNVANFPGGPLQTPTTMRDILMKSLKLIEANTPQSSSVYVMSAPSISLGDQILDCTRYGTPPFFEAYNQLLIDETEVSDKGMLAFKNFSKSYIWNVHDITEPLWDDMPDWGHHCRHTLRPMVRRFLLLAAKNIPGREMTELER